MSPLNTVGFVAQQICVASVATLAMDRNTSTIDLLYGIVKNAQFLIDRELSEI
jgi:hypothetical protein